MKQDDQDSTDNEFLQNIKQEYKDSLKLQQKLDQEARQNMFAVTQEISKVSKEVAKPENQKNLMIKTQDLALTLK